MKTTFFLSLSLLLLPFTGRAQNPFLVQDIAGGFSSSHPDHFVVIDNKILFAADTYSGGSVNRELFSSDGTSAGTHILVDIIPGASSSSPQKMVAYDDKVYFIICDSTSGDLIYRPWVSDGTVSGTFPVLPPAVTPLGYSMVFNSLDAPENLFVRYQGEVFFRAREDNNNNDFAIFKTDGTFAGAITAAALPNSTNIPNLISGPVVFRDSIYFSGTSNGSVVEDLYSFTGTVSTVNLIKNDVSLHAEMGTGIYGDQLFFCGSSSNGNGPELWVTDGTAAGTFEYSNLRLDVGLGSMPGSFIKVNGNLYFIANTNGTSVDLYLIDSTQMSSSPIQLAAISYIPFDYEDNYLLLYNNKLFFCGHDFINGTELWSSDGTINGTGMVADLNPGSANADPAFFTEYCGDLFFSAYNPSGQLSHALYKTDGSLAGTILLPGISGNPNGGEFTGTKIVYDGKLFYCGQYDLSIGNELYAYDAGCITGLTDIGEFPFRIYPNPASSSFQISLEGYDQLFTEIYDLTGRLVSQRRLAGDDRNHFNVTGWDNGCYIVKVSTGSEVFFKQVIVAHSTGQER